MGIGAVAGLLAFRSTSHAAPTSAASSTPAATWNAGAKPAPPIRLTNQNGRAVSLAAFRGRNVIVTFIDPLCRNYCPIEASRLDDVVQSLPAASRPAILAVSVNVYGNARRYLLQDIGKWKLGSEWQWGVGSDAQLGAVWKHYGIAVLDQKKTLAGVTVHAIVHTEAAYVVDANGDERALYLWPFTAAGVKATLAELSS